MEHCVWRFLSISVWLKTSLCSLSLYYNWLNCGLIKLLWVDTLLYRVLYEYESKMLSLKQALCSWTDFTFTFYCFREWKNVFPYRLQSSSGNINMTLHGLHLAGGIGKVHHPAIKRGQRMEGTSSAAVVLKRHNEALKFNSSLWNHIQKCMLTYILKKKKKKKLINSRCVCVFYSTVSVWGVETFKQ